MSISTTAQHVAQVAEKGGAAVAASTGIVSWATQYGSLLTICIGLAGLVVGIIGHYWRRQADKRLIQIRLEESRRAEEKRAEERALFEAQMAAMRGESQ